MSSKSAAVWLTVFSSASSASVRHKSALCLGNRHLLGTQRGAQAEHNSLSWKMPPPPNLSGHPEQSRANLSLDLERKIWISNRSNNRTSYYIYHNGRYILKRTEKDSNGIYNRNGQTIAGIVWAAYENVLLELGPPVPQTARAAPKGTLVWRRPEEFKRTL